MKFHDPGPKRSRPNTLLGTSISAPNLILALMLFGMGMSASALEVALGKNTAGKKILSDDKGREVVFVLRQFPISYASIDLLPIAPTYTEAVYTDRRVTFSGAMWVRTMGSASHLLTNQQYGKMINRLRALNFGSMKSSRSGGYYANLRISLDGIVQEINFDESNAQQYVEFRNAFEEYLRTMSYRCPLQNPGDFVEKWGFCRYLFEYGSLLEESKR